MGVCAAHFRVKKNGERTDSGCEWNRPPSLLARGPDAGSLAWGEIIPVIYDVPARVPWLSRMLASASVAGLGHAWLNIEVAT